MYSTCRRCLPRLGSTKVGNREMYTDWAMITSDADEHSNSTNNSVDAAKKVISGNDVSTSKLSSIWSVKHDTNHHGFQSLPELFNANMNGEGECVTIKVVGFPLLGQNVVDKSNTKGYKYSENATLVGLQTDWVQNIFTKYTSQLLQHPFQVRCE